MQTKHEQIAKETLAKNKTLMQEKEEAFVLTNSHVDPEKAAKMLRQNQITKEMWKELLRKNKQSGGLNMLTVLLPLERKELQDDAQFSACVRSHQHSP